MVRRLALSRWLASSGWLASAGGWLKPAGRSGLYPCLPMTTEPVQTWASSEAAEVWRQGAARRAQALAVATERMLKGAGVQPGMRVLDVAAGTGDQSLLAARLVGPSGAVLATDISASMLRAAAT